MSKPLVTAAVVRKLISERNLVLPYPRKLMVSINGFPCQPATKAACAIARAAINAAKIVKS